MKEGLSLSELRVEREMFEIRLKEIENELERIPEQKPFMIAHGIMIGALISVTSSLVLLMRFPEKVGLIGLFGVGLFILFSFVAAKCFEEREINRLQAYAREYEREIDEIYHQISKKQYH